MANLQADVFGFKSQKIAAPATADKAILSWGGDIYGAVQVQVSYQQQVNRRRTIGGSTTLVWGASPSGQISIQRLITAGGGLFDRHGWTTCDLGKVSIDFVGCEKAYNLVAAGCIVSNFTASAEAEGLTCMENVVIDFVQLVTS
jgi:hypothetical protein